MINVNGTLYGTTVYGGSTVFNGFGTVYSISTTGKETILHSFDANPDGANPYAGLVDVNGTLYGTTSNDGACAFCGTVYSITTSGSFKVLHDFGSGSDGEYSFAGLIDVKGTLYGTTVTGGGSSGNGTVFSITTTGKEKVLYSFGNSPDGATPEAGLIDVRGTLYGITIAGGLPYCENVVFTMVAEPFTALPLPARRRCCTASMTVRIIRSRLIDVNGTMYGTALGGGNGCSGNGCGIVYSVSTTGYENDNSRLRWRLSRRCFPRCDHDRRPRCSLRDNVQGRREEVRLLWRVSSRLRDRLCVDAINKGITPIRAVAKGEDLL